MNNVNEYVSQFLNKKQNAWSPTTLVMCKAFLGKYAGDVLELSSSQLLDKFRLAGLAPYTIQTYFIHAGNFYGFVYPDKTNHFKEFKKENRNVFKNSYKTKEVGISYEEVEKRLETIKDCPEKEAVIYLLKTAQRSSEAGLYRSTIRWDLPDSGRGSGTSSTTIIGKGGKERPNLGADLLPPGDLRWNYYRVYRFCRRHFGISPHSLRKLALTRAADRGAGPADLCAIAGWSSIVTAYRYLQPKSVERLKGFLG